MDHHIETPEITVYLNSDSFGMSDSQELGDRLRTELELRVETGVMAAYWEPGFPLPPDLTLNILYTLVPLADIYAGVLANAISDALRAAASRRGKSGDTEVTFRVCVHKVDEHEDILREVSGEVRGRTNDTEFIRDLIRQLDEVGF